MIPSKIKLTLLPVNLSPFNCLPAREIEVESKLILCNDIRLPRDSNCHNTRLWCIGNESGVCGVIWADCEQDALDTLCDEGLSAGLMIEEKEADEETARLGNAGEPHDLTHAWIQAVDLSPEKHWQLLIWFAEARGGQWKNLDN